MTKVNINNSSSNSVNMSNSTDQETAEKFSFRKGWNQLQQKDVAEAKADIMRSLEITTPQAFYARLRGDVEHRPWQVDVVEAVFAKYGITEIWGE